MNITIESTDNVLSVNGGLLIAKELSRKVHLQRRLQGSIPAVYGSFDKFRHLAMGFCAGAQCLDDMAVLAGDQGFCSVIEQDAYCPKTYGDYLRSFSEMEIKKTSVSLARLGFELREELFPEASSITFDFDSTPNEQFAKKKEGVEENYKGIECLDTFQVFDERGIQYYNEVRPGNTFSANSVSTTIHQIISQMPETRHFKKLRRYGRADSAFCNAEFFIACNAKCIGFVTAMRENMLSPKLWQVRNWEKCRKIKFYDDRPCEIGETVYMPEDYPTPLRVVVIRAVKKGRGGLLLQQEDDYDYHAWITNIGAHEMNSEKLIFFYRGRGHAENFIRELKNGFDLHHYPCLKLNANRAYGLIAAFAYNLMRFISLKDNPHRPQFSKAIRNRFIHIPAQIVRHARGVVFRFMTHHFLEVRRWLNVIENLQFGFS